MSTTSVSSEKNPSCSVSPGMTATSPAVIERRSLPMRKSIVPLSIQTICSCGCRCAPACAPALIFHHTIIPCFPARTRRSILSVIRSHGSFSSAPNPDITGMMVSFRCVAPEHYSGSRLSRACSLRASIPASAHVRLRANCAHATAIRADRSTQSGQAHPTRNIAILLLSAGALDWPSGRRLQELLQLLAPEFCHARGGVAARVFAGRYEVEPAVLDAFEFALGDSGFRRITLVVGRIDRQQRGVNAFKTRGGIVVARRLPLVQKVVGIAGRRGRQAPVDELVGLLPRGRRLLVCERSSAGSDAEEYGGQAQRPRLCGVVAIVPFRIAPDRFG